MRRRGMRKSVIAKGKKAYADVFYGRKVKTCWGLRKADLKLNARGKVVSKRKSEASKKKFAASQKLVDWARAVKKGRVRLGFKKEFVAVNGRSPKGRALFAKAVEFAWDAATERRIRIRLAKMKVVAPDKSTTHPFRRLAPELQAMIYGC